MTIDPEEERLQRIAQRFRSKQGVEGEAGQGASIITGRDNDTPPWEDDIPDALASDLFPTLNNESGAEIPPPTPDRDRDSYDRNNWSRLLRQARDMGPEIAEYLETLYKTGIGLELKKYKTRGESGKVRMDSRGKPVIIKKFKFTPGEEGEGNGNNQNSGWDDRRIKEIMSALYTYMAYLPARKELDRGDGQKHVVVQAMEAAIRAGGLLAVNQEGGGQGGRGGLKFDWSRADTEERKRGVEEARKLMDQCGAEIMSYIKLAERRLRDIGFVVSLAEMSDCVEDFG